MVQLTICTIIYSFIFFITIVQIYKYCLMFWYPIILRRQLHIIPKAILKYLSCQQEALDALQIYILLFQDFLWIWVFTYLKLTHNSVMYFVFSSTGYFVICFSANRHSLYLILGPLNIKSKMRL